MLGTRGRARQVAVRPEAAHWALPPLPLPLVLAVADRLPADDKLRLAFVSPAFRAVADERRLYRDVRLCAGSGVRRAGDSLLRAISAKARGTMRTLDVSGLMGGGRPVVSVDAVAAVCAANADTLKAFDARCKDELDDYLEHDEVARLLASAPRLLRLETDSSVSVAQVQALLRNPALRVRRLCVGDDFDDPASVVALVTALAAHPSVTQLRLCYAPLNAAVALDAVVDFAHNTGLATLSIHIELELSVSAAFCAALRACSLTRLVLSHCRLFDDPSGLALLAAATAHPVLQHIDVAWNKVAVDARPAVGAALGALVGANAPTLTSLDVSHCNLGGEGLRPLVDALPGNTALRLLRCHFNNVSRPCVSSLLAAVRANTSLRTLEANNGEVRLSGGRNGPLPALAQAEALVAARA